MSSVIHLCPDATKRTARIVRRPDGTLQQFFLEGDGWTWSLPIRAIHETVSSAAPQDAYVCPDGPIRTVMVEIYVMDVVIEEMCR